MVVRVLVVDDQEPFRRAAAAVVASVPGFELVGQVASGEESVAAAAALRPDVVLMDVVLPGIDGPTATRRIRAADPSVVVVLVSTYEADDWAGQALDAGAIGFVSKGEFGPETLLWAVSATDRPEPPDPA